MGGSMMKKWNLHKQFQDDLRKLGGILFVIGICVYLSPIKDVVVLISQQYNDDSNVVGDDISLLQLFMMIGDLCVVLLGLLAMAIGYCCLLIRDDGYFPKMGILFALIWEQTTYIEWITTMIYLVNNWVIALDGTRYFLVTGFLTVFFLGFLSYGSLGLVLFTIHDYYQTTCHTTVVPTRTASYYRNRLCFYSLLFMGLSAVRFLSPGIKVYLDEGRVGPLEEPYEVVAGTIVVPGLDIAIGCFGVVVGLWGYVRANSSVGHLAGTSTTFGIMIGLNYIAVVTTILLSGYGSTTTTLNYSDSAAVATSRVAIFLPAHIILAFLDDMAGSVPEQYDMELYCTKDNDDDKRNMTSTGKEEEEKEEEEIGGTGGGIRNFLKSDNSFNRRFLDKHSKRKVVLTQDRCGKVVEKSLMAHDSLMTFEELKLGMEDVEKDDMGRPIGPDNFFWRTDEMELQRQARYKEDQEEWATTGDRLHYEVFGWDKVKSESSDKWIARKGPNTVRKLVWMKNKFPYAFEDGVQHDLCWATDAPAQSLEECRASIEEHLGGLDEKDIVWFTNSMAKRSVPEIDHIQVIYRDPKKTESA